MLHYFPFVNSIQSEKALAITYVFGILYLKQICVWFAGSRLMLLLVNLLVYYWSIEMADKDTGKRLWKSWHYKKSISSKEVRRDPRYYDIW